MEEIILKEFRQLELTDAEKLMLEYWLKEDPKHQKVYAQMKLILLYPKPQENQIIKERAWNEIGEQLKAVRTKNRSKWNKWWRWLQVAAMVCITLSFAL